MIIAIFLIFKYQEQIEDWIIATFTKGGKQKILDKKKKQAEQKLLEEVDKNQKQDSKDYVNFEDAEKTKNDYVNFEKLDQSNGTQSLAKGQKDEK